AEPLKVGGCVGVGAAVEGVEGSVEGCCRFPLVAGLGVDGGLVCGEGGSHHGRDAVAYGVGGFHQADGGTLLALVGGLGGHEAQGVGAEGVVARRLGGPEGGGVVLLGGGVQAGVVAHPAQQAAHFCGQGVEPLGGLLAVPAV